MTTLNTHIAATLVERLLTIGGWRSAPQTILEAFPHMSDRLDARDVAQTIENLGVPHSKIRCREREITQGECPALVIPDVGKSFVVVGARPTGLTVANIDGTGTYHRLPSRQGCYVIRIDRFKHAKPEAKDVSVAETFSTIMPMLPWLLGASLLVNVLGLLTPLLIMGIYDRVIPAGSVDLLISLAIGVVIILASDFAFRHARNKALAYVGRQSERKLSLALFRKLMSLPLDQVQKSGVDQQIARFRQFEALREIFTGQVMTTLLDLPFALIFLSVLLYLAPAVGIMTLIVVVVFVALSALSIPRQQRLDAEAGEATAASRTVFRDAVHHQRAIVELGLAEIWQQREAPLTAAAEAATRRARQFQTSMQSLAQTAVAFATVSAIVFSANAAVAGDMSFGALIAVIALVSKVLAPIHALHSNLPQILTFRKSRAQADRVLSLPEEIELGSNASHTKALSGAISFSGVTYRPDPLYPPILSQASFVSKPGEVVMVMSCTVTSRTALLDLIDGLYTPIGGTIEHDEIDIRQIARDELRRAISYVPYDPGLFYGTVEQNFRLACPTLTGAQIKQALRAMDLCEDVSMLPNGAETRLNDEVLADLSPELAKCLALARGMVRSSEIYLFSEPTDRLSQAKRESFKAWVAAQRGRKTIFIATADRSFTRLADRFVYIDNGRITVNDTGDAGLKKIQAVMNKSGAR